MMMHLNNWKSCHSWKLQFRWNRMLVIEMLNRNRGLLALEVDEYQGLLIGTRKGGVVVVLEHYCIWQFVCDNDVHVR